MYRTTAILIIAALFSPTCSYAAFLDQILRLDAVTSEGEGGGYTWQTNAASWEDGHFQAWLPSDVQILDQDNSVIATIQAEQTFVYYEADPVVKLNFSVTAGASDTTVTISSGLLEFSPLFPTVGIASAGISISDSTGDSVTRSGLLDGKSFTAHYNGDSASGTLFASLLSDDSAGLFQTSAASDSHGIVSINDAVRSMHTQFRFSLSAGDQASGTSVFAVIPVPEPSLYRAAASMLIFAACARIFRQRQKGRRSKSDSRSSLRGDRNKYLN
ncbi:hypothetical protein [Crateriforma conspicua]|uniref:hypothetical protein n=1 Tax=Crateriforma conspicua TaxID=2527996 RepID=UPI001189A0E5|nr:hypothetical protein [Crateriforma conspicua]QDV65160.1 hypothetical protein Mal65_43300 [Crateriforma conspicua]